MYYIGAYFLMVAIFCGILSSKVGFNLFAAIGAGIIALAALIEWGMK
jgi:hypothetical protein